MYCKHCGKQITDDSLFCQFCGGKQDVEAPTENKESKNVESYAYSENKQSLISMTPKKKKYLILYLIWALVHILCWMFGETKVYYNGYSSLSPQTHFFPFTTERYASKDFFDVDFYDYTEFLVYVLLIPLVLYFYVQFCHKPLMQKIKENKKKQ